MGPPPEVTPTKDPETTNNTDLNDIGNEMITENNQDSAPDSFKHPGINIVVNPPVTAPADGSPKILGTPRRSTPSPRNEESNEDVFMDGMSEKLKEIQSKADLIDSPRQRTTLIDNEYWGWIAKAAANLKWNMDTLNDSIKGNNIFKSIYISNAKRLRQLPLGADIGIENVTIGNPDLVTSNEKLEFIKYLHEEIEKLELKAPQKKLTTRSRLPTGKASK